MKKEVIRDNAHIGPGFNPGGSTSSRRKKVADKERIAKKRFTRLWRGTEYTKILANASCPLKKLFSHQLFCKK